MLNTGDLGQLQVLLSCLNVPTGGGGGGSVTQREVQISAFNFAEVSGVNNAFVATLDPPVLTLTDGLIVTLNSGSLFNTISNPTLQVNALTPKEITLWGGLPLAAGDIQSSTVYLFLYDLADDTFQLINPSVSSANTFLVQSNFYNAAVDSGTSDAYVVTLVPAPDGSFGEGFPLYFRATNANTGASTITVNGQEETLTLQGGVDLPAGAIAANGTYYCLYSTGAGGFILMNPTGSIVGVTSATGTENQVLVNGTFGDPQEGNLTFTLPQDIGTTSNPTFGNMTINGSGIGHLGVSSLYWGYNALNAFVSDGIGGIVAIGYNCLPVCENGGSTVAIGELAGENDTSPGYTVYVGYLAGGDMLGPYDMNTFIGCQSGSGIETGGFNTLIGGNTGGSTTAIQGAIGIGYQAVVDPSTGNTSADDGPGISIGSGFYKPGYRGDGSAYPAGSGAGYWRVKVNNAYGYIPVLTDGSQLMWPGTTGTLAVVEQVVLLNPGADQVISTGGLYVTNGVYAGTPLGGSNNYFISYSATSSLGSLAFQCANNGGNYANVLTNASTSAARTWTLPDTSGTIALTSGIPSLGNFTFTGNTMSVSNANGDIAIVPNGTGTTLIGGATAFTTAMTLQIPGISSNPDMALGCFAANGTNAGVYYTYRSRSTTIGSFSAVQSGDIIGYWTGRGDDGTSFQNVAAMQFNVDAAVSTGIVPGNIKFYTVNTSGVLTQALYIASDQTAYFASDVFAQLGGAFTAASPTAALGFLQLLSPDNAGNYGNVLTNTPTTAARTWTLPDESGTIALSGEIPSNNYVESTVSQDSPVVIAPSTGVPTTVTSLTLAAGKWAIGGNGYARATGLINALVVGLSETDNGYEGDSDGNDPDWPCSIINGLYVNGTNVTQYLPTGVGYFDFAVETTVYLVVQYNCNNATAYVWGKLWAYNY